MIIIKLGPQLRWAEVNIVTSESIAEIHITGNINMCTKALICVTLYGPLESLKDKQNGSLVHLGAGHFWI